MIETVCKRVNGLLYIPLDCNVEFNTVNKDDYDTALSQARIDTLQMILKFKNEQ